MTSKSSLSSKIILMVECILLISSILFCTVSVYRARVGIRRAIQQRMLDIANCAAGSVNGDVLKGLGVDDIGSSEYNDIYDTLAIFRDNVELEYVYSIKDAGDNNFIFIMDTDPDDPGQYGESVEYTDALGLAGKGTPAVDEVSYSDAWGEFYSAYSPVFDSSGEVAGVIAADFSADWFEAQLSEQTRSTVISYVIILVLTQLLAAALSLLIVRPFVRMQGELFEEKVRAESANNAKSDFLANMSHEIRTPINAVLGMNEMILRENSHALELPPSDKGAMQESLNNIGSYAQDVKKAGHNLLAIVNDILDFSKIEAGRFDIGDAPYSLSSLLNDLHNMILFKAQDKDLDFTMKIDESLPDELSGDEVRIRQILTNLLNNAVKYTARGSVLLTINGEKQGDNTLLLKAVIKDTGIGIKQEDLEKLFTKFERLEMEHNSTVEGTGLGLVITKRLLELMGGSITVESEYGKGSVFTVTIPQKIIKEAPVGNLQVRLEMDKTNTGSYRETFRAPSAHILIVDDTKMNLTVVVKLLKKTQLQIDTASGGAESVAMAEKTAYDLILMDQRMPEMDGTEALHRIRATEGGASSTVPIICLTADAVIGAKERYLAEGFSDYLTKPVNNATLEKMLMKHLPKDKVERITEGITERKSYSGSGAQTEAFSSLRKAGVDPDIGIKYAQNDQSLYRDVLKEYVSSKPEREENLKKNLEARNWHNYSIYVHSLKSASKTIGVLDIFEQASRLEAAANTEDIGTILAGHDAMMRRYDEVASAITSLIPEAGDEVSKNGIIEFAPQKEKKNDVVMEFLPE